MRPDLDVVPIRGNVDTRVSNVEKGEYDATVLAAAGLVRLGMVDRISERFDPVAFVPAPGQGALAVQALADSGDLAEALRRIDDPDARRTAAAERICLALLGGGCARPIGAHARIVDGHITLTAFVGSVDGSKLLRAESVGTSAPELGGAVADELLRLGAGALLA
jgi:hydroxymethylbilane synthase